RRRLVRDREIGSHLAVAQFNPDVLRLHPDPLCRGWQSQTATPRLRAFSMVMAQNATEFAPCWSTGYGRRAGAPSLGRVPVYGSRHKRFAQPTDDLRDTKTFAQSLGIVLCAERYVRALRGVERGGIISRQNCCGATGSQR